MINYELSELFFEFSMSNIEFEEEIVIVQEILQSKYDTSILNEKVMESKNVIAKILDKICEFIDKVIMKARSFVSQFKLSSVKNSVEKIRKSTKEPKDMEFTLLKPKVNLLKKDAIKKISPDAIDFGVFDNGKEIGYNLDNPFLKKIQDKETKNSEYIKNTALDFVSSDIVGANTNNIEKVEDMLKKDEIKINKSNCRNNTGVIEAQFEEISKYMDKEFGQCINELSKVKNDARKFKVKTLRTNHTNVYGANMNNEINAVASFYQKSVNYTVQYLFKSVSFYISCLKKNVSNFGSMLL